MEFPPFTGTSIADFVYRDTKGALTSILFDSAQVDHWRGKWPTYYLEVKATTGSPGEAFHASPAQLNTVSFSSGIFCLKRFPGSTPTASLTSHTCASQAFRMRMVGHTAPQNIYVLVRVSSVRSQPSVQMYPDPWRLLCEGRLKHVSDVDMALAPV